MNIVVLTGGISTERNVAITSGKRVAAALRSLKHNVVLLDVFLGCPEPVDDIPALFTDNRDIIVDAELGEVVPDLDRIKKLKTGDTRRFLGENVEEICRFAEICFLALHGDVGENGKLQATFDLLGIHYTGSGSLGSALAMNKGVAKSIFATHGIPTPDGTVFTPKTMPKWNSFPCVVKPCSGGSSVGVSIVNCTEELSSALSEAFRYEDEVLVEKYIKGREFSVGILDNFALPVIEIIPKSGFYDYVNKYQSGKTQEICPAELEKAKSDELSEQALKVFNALHLDAYARVDFLLDEDGNTYCLEANTLPGMTPVSLLPQEAAACGISYEKLCDTIIEISMKKYGVEI